MITLKYNLNEQDYVDFNLFHYLNSPSMKRQHKVQLITVPVIFVVLAILYIVFIKPESIIAPILICAIGALIWTLVYPMIMKHEIKKQVLKLMKEGKKDELVGEYTLSIDDNGITELNPQFEVKSQFEAIQKILIDESHLYIYNSAMSAFMVPHSAFASTGEEDETVAYIKEHAGIM